MATLTLLLANGPAGFWEHQDEWFDNELPEFATRIGPIAWDWTLHAESDGATFPCRRMTAEVIELPCVG